VDIAGLEQHAAGTMHVVALVVGPRLPFAQGIDERVMDLLGRERHRPVPVERVAEHGEGRPQGRIRQAQDALDRGRLDGHAGLAQVAVEQELDDAAAEGAAGRVPSVRRMLP
jgi:hypothetical protein